jgi:hypothetical protein
MLIIVNRFRRTKREECNLNRTARDQCLGELQAEDTDTWAWAENFQFLQQTIDRPERGSIQRPAEAGKLRRDMPTHLGQDILLRFFRADTTELREAQIFEMYPENSFAVQVALTELCDHNLLVIARSSRTGKLYVVTTKGQSLCFSCGN